MKKIIAIIKEFLAENDLQADEDIFYSKDQWAERGESYGLRSELVVTHDGGDMAYVMNLDYEMYELNNRFNEHLRKNGYWYESCTGWYSAIYKL